MPSSGVLLARPAATGGSMLEEVYDLSEEQDLECELDVGKDPAALVQTTHGRRSTMDPRAFRLSWGTFAREIARLNERYFV